MKPTELGYVTLEYGARRSYWVSPTHTGIDYRAYTGTEIFACQDGRVTFAGYGGYGSSYGNHVVIEHLTPYLKRKVRVIYAHLSRNNVSIGEHVSRGDVIGWSGATGNVTAAHLHLEQRKYPYGYWDNQYPTVVNDRKIAFRIPSLGALVFPNVVRHRRRAVTRIQRALNQRYPTRRIKVTGKWNPATKNLYAHHQRTLGFKGLDANGEPGPTSLKNLGFTIAPRNEE